MQDRPHPIATILGTLVTFFLPLFVALLLAAMILGPFLL